MAVVGRVRRIAEAKGVTPAQLTLAWVLARGEDVVPIPGTRSRSRLEENVGAVGVELSADALADIEAIAPAHAFTGTRYPAARMRAIGI